MKINLDSKTLAVQIPSGVILGAMATLISRFIHLPFIPTNLPMLVCAIIALDLLHLAGKIDIDISNLGQRWKFSRRVNVDNVQEAIQIYLEEHGAFLACLFASVVVMRSVFGVFEK